MDQRSNYLLGRGELLTAPVPKPPGGGPKEPPYEFGTARARLAPRVATAARAVATLPSGACPNDQAVALVTMHPRYVSKSDFPAQLLEELHLRAVGSRARAIEPEKWGTKSPPVGEVGTTQLFVAGTRRAFKQWESVVNGWNGGEPAARQLTRIEDVSPIVAQEKIRGIPEGRDSVRLEVVLHTGGSAFVVDAFEGFSIALDATPDLDRRRDIGGLCFLPVRCPTASLGKLAEFSFLRVLRGMPKLRPLRPGVIRSIGGFAVALPDEDAVVPSVRVAIFDGGLPATADLSRWVRAIDTLGVSAAVPEFQDHGLQVTSALLHGPLRRGVTAERPYASVDHYRVLGTADVDNADPDRGDDLFDVLGRIVGVLEAHRHRYHFVNISIGPDLATDDDEVEAWTAALDEQFARRDVLATVAVGNTGEKDRSLGLNRIQPPSDGVNVLAVGACDSEGDDWQRAVYSSVGPGRCPGVMKPDGVAFGGSDDEPFYTLFRTPRRAIGDQGTSFAAPLALRSALGMHAHLGDRVNQLALRALLIHHADFSRGSERAEVGWGRFPTSIDDLLTSADDEVHVVYQGDLPIGQYLRAPIPLPPSSLSGMITIAATICIAPQVDPEHPVTYTRSGLDVVFRPHSERYTERDGRPSAHPATAAFFSAEVMYKGELALREEGHKWEPCWSSARSKRADSLHEPCFDIYYHHREAGAPPEKQPEMPYALIVSVQAPKVPDLYDRVVRAYAAKLQPLTPIALRLPVRR